MALLCGHLFAERVPFGAGLPEPRAQFSASATPLRDAHHAPSWRRWRRTCRSWSRRRLRSSRRCSTSSPLCHSTALLQVRISPDMTQAVEVAPAPVVNLALVAHETAAGQRLALAPPDFFYVPVFSRIARFVGYRGRQRWVRGAQVSRTRRERARPLSPSSRSCLANNVATLLRGAPVSMQTDTNESTSRQEQRAHVCLHTWQSTDEWQTLATQRRSAPRSRTLMMVRLCPAPEWLSGGKQSLTETLGFLGFSIWCRQGFSNTVGLRRTQFLPVYRTAALRSSLPAGIGRCLFSCHQRPRPCTLQLGALSLRVAPACVAERGPRPDRSTTSGWARDDSLQMEAIYLSRGSRTRSILHCRNWVSGRRKGT